MAGAPPVPLAGHVRSRAYPYGLIM